MGFKSPSLPIFFLLLFISDDLQAIPNDASPILTPDKENPAEVNPGGTFMALVKVRLPLTPPPGVQQEAAKTGWHASLIRRDAIAADDGASILQYSATVIRYRPERDEVYRVTIMTNPWMPPGKYDLIMKAPGLDAEANNAVWVGARDDTALVIKRESPNSVTAFNSDQLMAVWHLDLVVPEGVSGFDVEIDGKKVAPSFVTLAGDTPEEEAARRVLHFESEVPGAAGGKSGRKTVSWTPVQEEKTCSASIRTSAKKEAIDPTIQIPLYLDTGKFDPVLVIWDFGDGGKETGAKVSHIFMLKERSKVRAFAFDQKGRTCAASAEFKVAVPLARDGCNCELTGETRRNSILTLPPRFI